jgi:phosphohistidine phosphatase
MSRLTKGHSVKVVLVRHGDAEADVPEGMDDDARALTVRGRAILPSHFSALRDLVGPLDAIWMSPLVRAVQTATLLAQALGFEGPLRSHRHLYPDSPVGAMEGILEFEGALTVALVGHQPTIGAFAAYLLGVPTFPRAVQPGTAIGLERLQAGQPARLLFYAAPGHPVAGEAPGPEVHPSQAL